MHKHGGDIYSHPAAVDFSANINYRGMPKEVEQAAMEGVRQSGAYPDTSHRKLREAIAGREQVRPDQVVCGNGAAELVFSLVLAKKPKLALLPAPTFYEYEQALRTVDCEIRRYYLKEEHTFELDPDFLEQITKDVDIVFLCNPNNPTGLLVQPEFLHQILKRCEGCDTLLVVDECFQDFLEEPVSMKAFLKESQNLFLLRAFTKMYALAGLRLGYGLCGNQELLMEIKRCRQPWCVSAPAQLAGIAAARDTEFALESCKEIGIQREILKEELIKSGFYVLDSKANYIFFQGPEDLYERCLKKGFLIRDCSNYEGLSPGWFRIAVRSRAENEGLLQVLRQEAGGRGNSCFGNGTAEAGGKTGRSKKGG